MKKYYASSSRSEKTGAGVAKRAYARGGFNSKGGITDGNRVPCGKGFKSGNGVSGGKGVKSGNGASGGKGFKSGNGASGGKGFKSGSGASGGTRSEDRCAFSAGGEGGKRFKPLEERVIYEDNHFIAINKLCGEIVQADKSGDTCLIDDLKAYLKRKYDKPGNVFLGLPHRLDRPTSGAVLFCKTTKALERINKMFKDGDVHKVYYAIVDKNLQNKEGRLEHYVVRNTKVNKSFAYKDLQTAHRFTDPQKAVLEYEEASRSERYVLLKIRLLTGRHHQIRAQLAACGVHIKGDLKYGAARSNPDGGISLHSGEIHFVHPVSGKTVDISASFPESDIWNVFSVKTGIKTDAEIAKSCEKA